jgi:hypothetical protein
LQSFLLQGFERRVAVMNALHRVAFALQEFLEQRAQFGIVIDD